MTSSRLRLLTVMALLFCGCGGYQLESGLSALAPTRAVHLVFMRSFGERGSSSGCFRQPQGIACASFGHWYVADTGNDRIQEFDGEGRYVREIGGFGWSDGQFNRPAGIAAGRNLDIWVADTYNRRLVRLGQDLVWAGVINKDAEGGPLGYPNGIALNVDASIWCTDIDADRLIQLYQETPSELGARIQSTGILSDPAGVACSPDGKIVVADTGNDRIAVFDRFGTLLRTWGEGILLRPRGVNVTPQGDILIADTGNNRLVFLNRMYHLTGEHGLRGSEYGEFLEPCGVASDPAGNVVWVADTGNNRVQVFRVIRTTE